MDVPTAPARRYCRCQDPAVFGHDCQAAGQPAKPKPVRALSGPHCPHDECGFGVCGHTGLAEFPCRVPGCSVCGGPDPASVEAWASRPRHPLTPAERARVDAYLAQYPMMRRAPLDTAQRLGALW